MHYVATCVVQYRGERVICQSIIPGILNNQDLSSLSEYGTIDEQKTINCNEQFHDIMKQVAERLHISVNKVKDGQDKEVEIAGAADIKGIRGTDKRCYVVDLQGFTPRDANYLGNEHHSCLLRSELVVLYHRHRQVEFAKSEIKELEKTRAEERKALEKELGIEEGKAATEEQKTKMKEFVVKSQEAQQKAFEEAFAKVEQDTLNTNVFKSNVQLCLSEEELKVEEDKVKKLADYLKETAVTNLIKSLQKNDGVPTDSASLSEFFHQNGVNMRYLGHVAELLDQKKLTQLKAILERETVVRCLKHIIAR